MLGKYLYTYKTGWFMLGKYLPTKLGDLCWVNICLQNWVIYVGQIFTYKTGWFMLGNVG